MSIVSKMRMLFQKTYVFGFFFFRLIENASLYVIVSLNLFPNDKILDSTKLKEFEDDSFKFDENDRKSSKRIENTVRKGEIARYEQFLLFPQCFQKTSIADTQKPWLVRERGYNSSE